MRQLVLLIPGLGVPAYLWLWLRWERDNPLKHVPVANLAPGILTVDSDSTGLA